MLLSYFRNLGASTDMPARILCYLAPHWRHIMLAVFLTLLAAILGLVPPLLTKNILDQALPEKDLQLLCLLVLASILATVLQTLLQTGQSYLSSWLAKQIVFDLKTCMYSQLQYWDVDTLSSAMPGDITTRITSDIDGVQEVFNATLINAIRNILIIITTALALLMMNWKLAVVGMAILPLFIVPMRTVGKARKKLAAETQEMISELNQLIQETLGISGFILMKIFTREQAEYSRFKQVNEKIMRLQLKESLVNDWLMMAIILFISVGPMLIYLYGGYLYINDELSVGVIIAVIALLSRLYTPATQLSNIHVEITRSFALFRRIFDYLDRRPQIIDKPNALSAADISGEVEFAHVYFSYPNRDEVLSDINFLVEPGTIAAFVGASGAGKTTITNLIPRFYEPTAGAIRIDGVDIQALTLESLRQHIGIVMQDPYLFNDTIEENLRYGKADATKQEIIAACKSAAIHDYIMSLPEKYRTIVGNRGIRLSGGEKQRIAIARVILKNPRIIILDEATSSLDSVSEMLIQQALLQLFKGRTSFVVAHRLSTVLAANQIFVLENGRIVESGEHETLLEKNGSYKKLYDTQFQPAALNRA
jgi:ATP-binding cassette subfamily B protein